jgi:hypothetical protein
VIQISTLAGYDARILIEIRRQKRAEGKLPIIPGFAGALRNSKLTAEVY